jgi:hypothetical protein
MIDKDDLLNYIIDECDSERKWGDRDDQFFLTIRREIDRYLDPANKKAVEEWEKEMKEIEEA